MTNFEKLKEKIPIIRDMSLEEFVKRQLTDRAFTNCVINVCTEAPIPAEKCAEYSCDNDDCETCILNYLMDEAE